MTKTKVVIAFKVEDAKNRLAYESKENGILFKDERKEFASCLVRDVYNAWSKVIGNPGDVVVAVSNGTNNADISQYQQLGMNITRMKYSDINVSLAGLAKEAETNGYTQFIVSGSDLPLIVSDDIEYLLLRSKDLVEDNGRGVVFSLGNRGGTTVYTISPPTCYQIALYTPGKSNFEHQIERLEELGIPYIADKERINFFLDMDYPDDLVNAYIIMKTEPEFYQDRETYKWLIPLFQSMLQKTPEAAERMWQQHRKQAQSITEEKIERWGRFQKLLGEYLYIR